MAAVLGPQHIDHAAQRQRRIHFNQQFLDRVVVDLLEMLAAALGRLRRRPPFFDDLKHVRRANSIQWSGADLGPIESLQPGRHLAPIRL